MTKKRSTWSLMTFMDATYRASCTMRPEEGFNLFNFMSFVALTAQLIISTSNVSNNNNNNNNNNVSSTHIYSRVTLKIKDQ